MATRNLTEAFILMRNNALRNKHIYAEQNLSDRMALVSTEPGESDSVELNGLGSSDNNAPPAWINALEEAQYILTRLQEKIDSLKELQGRQLTRPTLDDDPQVERQMEQFTREISRAFSNGYEQVQTIKGAMRQQSNPAERELAFNAVRAVSSSLQELGLKYKSAQNNYLQQIKSREERNSQFFADENSYLTNATADSWLTVSSTDDSNTYYWQEDEQRQESLLLQLEDPENRMKLAVEREEQIGNIVQSIADLKYIFKDLANMIQDQGTILDRIDYNIEQTQAQVYEGYKQLQKADSYQKANRKMYCIVVLAAAIILLSILFMIFKT
ncbi:syntaxin-16 [Prorops nasuta]|uniref:syntaxin-16 n=1 Tax=Prorops nasuta TaxID=863751 RepID=UPI0034CE7197